MIYYINCDGDIKEVSPQNKNVRIEGSVITELSEVCGEVMDGESYTLYPSKEAVMQIFKV